MQSNLLDGLTFGNACAPATSRNSCASASDSPSRASSKKKEKSSTSSAPSSNGDSIARLQSLLASKKPDHRTMKPSMEDDHTVSELKTIIDSLTSGLEKAMLSIGELTTKVEAQDEEIKKLTKAMIKMAKRLAPSEEESDSDEDESD